MLTGTYNAITPWMDVARVVISTIESADSIMATHVTATYFKLGVWLYLISLFVGSKSTTHCTLPWVLGTMNLNMYFRGQFLFSSKRASSFSPFSVSILGADGSMVGNGIFIW